MKKSLSEAADDDDSCFSPFSCLPDGVVLEIFKKIMDLKTLCFCEAVSKRFYAIVHQVDAICYTPQGEFLVSVCKAMDKFSIVKSLYIHFLSNPFHKQQGVDNGDDNDNVNDDDDDGYLFKWMAKLSNNGSFSFVFVSPAAIYDKKNRSLLYEEKQNVSIPLKVSIAFHCFRQFSSLRMLICYGTVYLPLLEKVSCMDLGNRGRVSVNGRAKIDDLRSWIRSTIVEDIHPDKVSRCYVPLLELPVSGYVMKGVTLVLMDCNDVHADVTYDSFINDEIDFKQDKEEAAYHEAMREIFKKHRASIVRLD